MILVRYSDTILNTVRSYLGCLLYRNESTAPMTNWTGLDPLLIYSYCIPTFHRTMLLKQY